MPAVEKYTLRELSKNITNGKKYKLFKPFMYNGQILLNIEKVLTDKDLQRLEGKIFGPIEVIPAVQLTIGNKLVKAIVENSIKILKTSPIFSLNETHKLDYEKRKETEKLLEAIINGNTHLAEKMYEIYQYSKKLFLHSIRVAIIATVIDLGVQQKRKIHNALRSEELLTGALLHDIGFLGLDKEFCEKRRVEFTESQQAEYKRYPEIGRKLAKELGADIRSKSIDIIYQHQERLMGNGFPNQLKNDEIEELALIVGVADEFDLIVSKEIANHNKPISEVMSRISRSQKFFGNDIVDSFYTWFRYLK
ncbi:MAG: HD domain-containing protein [Spirochaetes bacterium]|nr:HD domain-containing protein [Spirochaetota bacterium]